MRAWVRLSVTGILSVLVAATLARAQLQTVETPDLRLIYLDPQQTAIAPYAARCFQNSFAFQQSLWDYDPADQVTVLLLDLSDQGNATASNVPRNSLIIDLAPLSLAYETVTPNERMNWIMNHELVHIATGDRPSSADAKIRRFFRGKVLPESDHPETILYFYLTTPRYAVPQWYREGIAVFVETWMAGGLGRAQGPWDEMVFRAKVRDDTHFYDPLGLAAEAVKADFQSGVNFYLYGTRFMSFLAYEYSPEKLIEWVSRKDGSKRYYAGQFRAVFGIPLEQAWQDWIAWERGFQQANLDSIRAYPITPTVDLSPKALGSVSRAFVDQDNGRLIGAFNYPGTVPHIGTISLADGSLRRLIDVKGPTLYSVTSLARDPHTGTMFYTSDNTSFRDLRSVDPEKGKVRVLQRDVRIGDLAFNAADRSLWGVRHYQGIATLVRMPEPWERWQQIHSWPYGEVIHDLDIAPDGDRVSFTLDRIDGSHTLQVHDLERLREDPGTAEPLTTLDFGNTIPSNFVFAPDGRSLYGTAYYTGVSNVYRLTLPDGDLQALTNTETGLFRPMPQPDGSLIAFRYSGDGFVPTRIEVSEELEDLNAITYLGERIAERHPVVRDWLVGSPADVPLDDLQTAAGPYEARNLIALESIYPIIEGYKDFPAYGFSLALSDPLSFHRFGLTTSYTPNSGLPDNEKLHLDFDYKYKSFNLGLSLNDADFYDLFGPTKRSRKGHVVDVGWSRNLIRDDPRRLDLDVSAAYYGDLEKLPRYQNVDATVDQLTEVGLHLNYSNRAFSLGAVDHEKGIHAGGEFGVSRVGADTIPTALGTFDIGFQLPIKNSSIWWRSAAGVAFGELADPFSNFFFGGFGNNYVDFRSTKRYRQWYAFPGAALNEFGGRNFARTMLEWNLPPLRFRRAGTPAFFVSWMRPSLFVSAIETNLDDAAAERRLTDAGVQFDFRITTLSRLNLTFSIGYAQAFESGQDDRDELMISLKVLD